MNVETWVAVIGLALALLGVVVRDERRKGKFLTREEHEKICADRNERVEKQLDELRTDMERRHQENRQVLASIDNATTGTHKRIDAIYRDLLNRAERERG